jgi:hypothetical protein
MLEGPDHRGAVERDDRLLGGDRAEDLVFRRPVAIKAVTTATIVLLIFAVTGEFSSWPWRFR